jgi:hypothetical protein
MQGINYVGETQEVEGLENKIMTIGMRILESTYYAAKTQASLAYTMLRSARSYARLYMFKTGKYYLAETKTISMEQTAGTGERSLPYQVEFEVRPWLYSDIVHRLTGTTTLDTNDVNRTMLDGTWTPTRLTVTGTDITVSGYTPAGDFTGFISISG